MSSGLSTNKTILIVEDNALNLKLYQDLLRPCGYNVVICSSGTEVVDLARRHKPDLILMDIQLPGISGFEAMKGLKSIDELKSILVVAVTSIAMKGDEEKIRVAGFDYYLEIPIRVPEFMDTIERFLG